MTIAIGGVKRVQVAAEGWSAWVTLHGLGRPQAHVIYDLSGNDVPRLSLSVTDVSGAVREVVATRVVRKPYPEHEDLDHYILGDDLIVRVALSEFVLSTSVAVASSQSGWAAVADVGGTLSAIAADQISVLNLSEIMGEEAAPVANFVTPDRQVVGSSIHVEVIAASIFANRGAEVAAVRFVARDQQGNEVSVLVNEATRSAWGKGDAEPVYSYGAEIPTAGLTEGDLITVRAEVIDHLGQMRASAANGSAPANPTAFIDQIYLLDADNSFGRAYAYVDASAPAGTGLVSVDPLSAVATPFNTIAAAMTATQVFNQQTFERANLDNAEIRLKAGTHVWVNGSLNASKATTDDVWVTITRDPAATIEEVHLTGPADGKNSFAFADHIKIEGVTIDRAPMGNSSAAIMRGQSGDALWLHDVVFEGRDIRAVSFQIPDIWVTQSDFNGTSRALTSFSTSLNMFRIRGIEAESAAGDFINGHLLVGSDLHNLAVRYPGTFDTPNANVSVVAFNEISTSKSTQLISINGLNGLAVVGNTFIAVGGPSPAVSISADGSTSAVSNVVFHSNVVLNARMNVGYNDIPNKNFDKTLISLKWNDLHQLNSKHDVFSKDSDNTGAWPVLYGVGFESNVVHNSPAGPQNSFGFAFDGLGSSGNGLLPPTVQQDIPDLAPPGSYPVATPDSYSMSEDTALDVAAAQGILANDYDVDGDPLMATLVVGPANGMLTFNPDGSFSYVPRANFSGTDSFSYIVTAGVLSSAPAAVAVMVQDVNDAPIALDDYGFEAPAGTSVRLGVGALLANDSDADDDALVLLSVQDPEKGSVEIVEGDVVFTVAPAAAGEALFTYTISDSRGGLSTATVRVPVSPPANQAPVFVSETAVSTAENQLAVLTAQVVDDDAGKSIVFSISGGPDAAHFKIDAGTGVLSFLFAPDFEAPSDADRNNVYEVVLGASDGALATDQALAITVTNLNDVSPAIGSDGGGSTAAITIAENESAATTVSAIDGDAGTTLTFSLAGGADATLFDIDAGSGVLSFMVAPDFEAAADIDGDNVYEVVVRAGDGIRYDEQALAVTIANLNDVSPVINSDGGGTSVAIYIVENDVAISTIRATDADGDTMLVYSIAGGADASLVLIDASTGMLGFAAAPDFEAPEDSNSDNVYEVIVRASDGTLAAEQAIAVTVTNSNEAPSAQDDVVEIDERATTANLWAALLANDTDADSGDTRAIVAVDTSGTAGSVSLDPASQLLTYVADAASFDTLGAGQSADDQFSYTIVDATGLISIAMVTVTVHGINEALFGSAGADALTGSLYGFDLYGLAGNDTYVILSKADRVFEASGLIEGIDTVRTSLASYVLPTNVEILAYTGTTDAVLAGNSLANHITGGAANDRLDGGSGSDRMEGGAGHDTYVVDAKGDIVSERFNSGTDTVLTELDHHTLTLYVENLVYTGNGSFTGTGNGGANLISGGDGDDFLEGGGGADTLVGGLGNDTYTVEKSGTYGDVLFDTGGIELIRSHVTWTLGAGFENLELLGSMNNSGTGNSDNNYIRGNAGANTLDGRAGADILLGMAGNDLYIVDDIGDLTIEYEDGIDLGGTDLVRAALDWTLADGVENLLFTGVGNATFQGTGNDLANTITGGNGADFLLGLSGNDTLLGGGGNDSLDGGEGADQLTGGYGNDEFILAKGSANGDVITDFAGQGSRVGDVIRITGWGTGTTFVADGHSVWRITDGIDGTTASVTIAGSIVVTDIMFG